MLFNPQKCASCAQNKQTNILVTNKWNNIDSKKSKERKQTKRSFFEKFLKFTGKVLLFALFQILASKKTRRKVTFITAGSLLFQGPRQVIIEATWRPLLFVTLAPPLIQSTHPGLYRTWQFWSRVIPIYIGYKITQKEAQTLPEEEKRLLWEKRHEWGSEKVYKLCTELRGFYLKDGQFLGTRADFMPAAWIRRLKTLQDEVPPAPFQDIRRTIETSLDKPIVELFDWIDPVPLASATIAQVHCARLKMNGQLVAVKAQYADQERLCQLDLSNLSRLAVFLQRHDLKFDLVSIVEEFQHQIPLEFDFEREAQMMQRISNNLRSAGILPQRVVIPQVTQNLVSRRVLVMNFIEGFKIDRLVTESFPNVDRNAILENIAMAYGHMLLIDGLFHADPHPGNLVFLEDGRIGIFDFGQVKEIEDDLRIRLCELFEALAQDNVSNVANAFSALGIQVEHNQQSEQLLSLYATGLFDTCALPAGVEINPFSEASPLKTARVRRFPSQLFMILRAMQLLRALTSALACDFSFARVFASFATTGKCLRRLSSDSLLVETGDS
ncbi:aarF domain-containing kinase [Galdieria sulphuraria]|uniref:AarF domain-containing kinase n=1 Tax=Galdieria sulphuraria TaxID=130081 RepID=M2X867_GALSU|nr:aarF domain-containing kinase [Galdieria sulphuraria]EME32755.1 aarF domain-containing kinase [Galdieria sulphuraria]|eukprot:XP_005709275.1 aarF domain-containing kinase [Galdieria sulphuraria]